MVPKKSNHSDEFQQTFDRTLETISTFWAKHRNHLQPWNPQGAASVGLTAKRFGAIVQVAQQDLRTQDGRNQMQSIEKSSNIYEAIQLNQPYNSMNKEKKYHDFNTGSIEKHSI